jgi:hypothetical protein
MENRIIEIVEFGFQKSLIQRKNNPINELIETNLLIQELNQLLDYNNPNAKFGSEPNEVLWMRDKIKGGNNE